MRVGVVLLLPCCLAFAGRRAFGPFVTTGNDTACTSEQTRLFALSLRPASFSRCKTTFDFLNLCFLSFPRPLRTAGLPTIFCTAAAYGGNFAEEAAIGSIWTCGMQRNERVYSEQWLLVV
ncbi:hypothetical protein IG631_06095 [Alternaria alternata]|nr:hypothetical protein IG631_06095 [Alternaria alternata]